MTPPGTQCFPKRLPAAGGAAFCVSLRGAGDHPPAVPRGPLRPPAPPLGVSSPPALLRVPARGSLVCSPWRQEEGRGPAAPSSVRRVGAQRSRGGRTTAGHVGRTAPQGRLRCAPAAGGPRPHLHREEAARALHDREVSATRHSPAPPPGRSPRGAGRRGAAPGAVGSGGLGLHSGALSMRGRSPWGLDKETAACASGRVPVLRLCPGLFWLRPGGMEIQALGKPI